jgi:hypothetical protein
LYWYYLCMVVRCFIRSSGLSTIGGKQLMLGTAVGELHQLEAAHHLVLYQYVCQMNGKPIQELTKTIQKHAEG